MGATAFIPLLNVFKLPLWRFWAGVASPASCPQNQLARGPVALLPGKLTKHNHYLLWCDVRADALSSPNLPELAQCHHLQSCWCLQRVLWQGSECVALPEKSRGCIA